MDVLILKQTRWHDKSLLPGDTINVDYETAKRWSKIGIAEQIIHEKPDKGSDEGSGEAEGENAGEQGTGDGEGDNGEQSNVSAYAGLKAKELYGLCKERGIEAESKQPEEYYINLLEDADKAESEKQ